MLREEDYLNRVRQLEQQMSRLSGKRPEAEWPEQYSQGLTEKLLAENKYLKMERHMLGRYKERAEQLKRENKQISSERDVFKKKLIENWRKSQLP